MDVSIIIINYRTAELTISAVEAVRNALENSISYQIIIVDNNSKDGSIDKLMTLRNQNTIVIETEYNGGFGYGNNIGAGYATGKYLFFLNSDTILSPCVLEKMIRYIERTPSTGILSCHMVDGNRTPLVVGHSFENLFTLFRQTIVKPVIPKIIHHWRGRLAHEKRKGETITADWVSGAALLMSSRLFHKVGGWCEDYFMYMEDEDLCRRVRHMGYNVEVYNSVGLVHLVGKSGGSEFVAREKYKSAIKYFRKYRAKGYYWIKILLLIQSWFYVKNMNFMGRVNLIKKLLSA